MRSHHFRQRFLTKWGALAALVLAGFLSNAVPVSAQVAAQKKAGVRRGSKPPLPTENVTITWDERFQQVPTKVAVVKNVAILEGDIAIGTIDDVRKAQRNELTGRARRLRDAGAIDDSKLGLPKSALELLHEVADLPLDPSNLKNASANRPDVIRLLRDIERFGLNQLPKVPAIEGERAAPDSPALTVKYPVDALRKFREDVLTRKKLGMDGVDDAPPAPSSGRHLLASSLPRNSPYLWTNGVVPYYIEQGFTDDYVTTIEEAMNLWGGHWAAGRARLHFRPYQAGDQHWIQFRFSPGLAGSSPVGMRSPAGLGQLIMLPGDGFPRPNIAHEIGHSIGLFHEQSRSDRDNYLQINTANVETDPSNPDIDFATQFLLTQEPNDNHGAFDFGSVMLYNAWAFSNNYGQAGSETMVSLWPRYSGSPDHWGLNSPNIKGPSAGDFSAVEAMYPGPANLNLAPLARGAQAAPDLVPDGNLFVGPPDQAAPTNAALILKGRARAGVAPPLAAPSSEDQPPDADQPGRNATPRKPE